MVVLYFVEKGFTSDSVEVKCHHRIANADNYTLSHPENGRDVTERAQGYMLQDASLCVNPGVPF